MVTNPQAYGLSMWASMAVTFADGVVSQYDDIYPMYYRWCKQTDRIPIRNRRIWIRELRRMRPCKYNRGRFYGIAVGEIL